MRTATLTIVLTIILSLKLSAQVTRIDSIVNESIGTLVLNVQGNNEEFKILSSPITHDVFTSEKLFKFGEEELRLWKTYKVLEVKTGIIYTFKKWATSQDIYLTIEFKNKNKHVHSSLVGF